MTGSGVLINREEDTAQAAETPVTREEEEPDRDDMNDERIGESHQGSSRGHVRGARGARGARGNRRPARGRGRGRGSPVDSVNAANSANCGSE